jgi:Bax protein
LRKKILLLSVSVVGAFFVLMSLGFSFETESSSSPSTGEAEKQRSENKSKRPTIRVETRSYTSVEHLSRALDSIEPVRSTEQGTRFVIVKEFPDDFGNIRSVDRKKRLFREVLLPIIRLENTQLQRRRDRLTDIIDQQEGDGSLSPKQRKWVRKLMTRYEVVEEDANDTSLTAEQFQILRRRLNVVPPSLVLAQAANESAWGTSRFCLKANNVFGEWTYDKSEGLKPEGISESAPHRIKIFPDVRSSLRSYMLNLNTHTAYESFRQLRAEQNDSMNSLKLVQGLEQYSSRRGEYVESISNLIQYNDFRQYDRF